MIPTNVETGSGMRCSDPENIGIGSAKALCPTGPITHPELCAVQKDSDTQQVWVFRHQNKREKFNSENVRGRAKGGGVFQMIWGCFAGTKLGPIVFINERVNTNTLLFYAKTSFHLLMLSLQMVQRTLFSNKTMPLLMLLKEHVYGLRMQCASMDLC